MAKEKPETVLVEEEPTEQAPIVDTAPVVGIEPVEVPTPQVAADPVGEESDAKKAYRKHLYFYEKQNPVKYAAKKEELEAKLNAIK